MTTLENLIPNAAVKGILPDCLVAVVGVKWFGSDPIELAYRDRLTGSGALFFTARTSHESRSRRKGSRAVSMVRFGSQGFEEE